MHYPEGRKHQDPRLANMQDATHRCGYLESCQIYSCEDSVPCICKVGMPKLTRGGLSWNPFSNHEVVGTRVIILKCFDASTISPHSWSRYSRRLEYRQLISTWPPVQTLVLWVMQSRALAVPAFIHDCSPFTASFAIASSAFLPTSTSCEFLPSMLPSGLDLMFPAPG